MYYNLIFLRLALLYSNYSDPYVKFFSLLNLLLTGFVSICETASGTGQLKYWLHNGSSILVFIGIPVSLKLEDGIKAEITIELILVLITII